VGSVAGRGEARAENGDTPAKTWRAGVVIALPPFPRRPDKNPTMAPVNRIIRLDSFMEIEFDSQKY